MSYADKILNLKELKQASEPARQQQPIPVLRIGITDVVPKSFAYRLLAPVGKLPEPVRLVCREGSIDMLLAELALQHLICSWLIVRCRPVWRFEDIATSWVRAPWHSLALNPCAPVCPIFRRA